jgi:hypothetical protein
MQYELYFKLFSHGISQAITKNVRNRLEIYGEVNSSTHLKKESGDGKN